MTRNRLYPRWMGVALALAGAYNLCWGAWVVFAPAHSFAASGMQWPDRPLTYPQLWQCVGAAVGLYGLAYLLAASDPVRHWPVVLVGLIGKVVAPAGYALAAANGELPWSGVTAPLADVIWWVPFALILVRARQVFHNEETMPAARPLTELIETVKASDGRTLAEISADGPALVVFVRHFGCVFCREALADLARQRDAIQATGTRLVVVHMGSPDEGAAFLARYGLGDVAQVSDPGCELYRAAGLGRGTFRQLLGPRTWWRGAGAFFRQRHGFGLATGDAFRMPGVFLLERGRVVRSFKHERGSDRPDYLALTHCPVPMAEPGAFREVS